MRIKNVLVYGEDQKFSKGTVQMENGKFVSVDDTPMEEIDGQYGYLIPGLVDIHFHGCMGADLSDGDAEGIQKMADYEASIGVTSICPATMTVAEDELHKAFSTAGNYQSENGARFVGINMEGPFISAKKKGAQAADNIRKCDVNLFHQLQKEANGRIKLVDIAPEEDGAMEFIEQVKDEVVISLAHTVADYDTSMEAFKRGASHATHLYNAMPPLNHREPGVIGAARDYEGCHAELICDGVHVHPAMIRATFAMFGKDRMILISDSMRATGLEDGMYTLGGQAVKVEGNRATLEDGTIAGSATNLMDCMRYAVKTAKIPLEDAIAAATVNPAKEIGIYDDCGSITVGKLADCVLLDSELNVVKVYMNGNEK